MGRCAATVLASGIIIALSNFSICILLNIPYWIDAWVFDDDPLLSPEIRKRLENRGGSGIMKTQIKDGIQMARQDIILGLNVPGYPVHK